MDIIHKFYEDEIRCDYLVPSMMKRTWAAQIEILADLDKACTENKMEYFAEWGTLLGVIRHEGFIPWDDDMDICMKRGDYNSFTRNVSSFLPENYSIVNYRSSRDFKQMLSRIVSSDHYRFDAEYMHKYSGLPFPMGIDIFPLDFLSDDEEYEREREERATLVFGVVNDMAKYDLAPSAVEDDLKKIESRCHAKIDRKGDVLTQLRELLEKIFAEVDEKDAAYITLYPLWMGEHSYRFPVGYYKNGIRMKFENTTIPVPVCYDAILKHKYGPSYMMPVRSGGAHEYPYYENHVKVLKEHFGFEWPAYKFNERDLVRRKDADDEKTGGVCLFITYDAKAFANMRSLAGSYIDRGYEVRIMPVTKYDIAPDMTGITADTHTVSDEYYLEGLEEAVVTHDPDEIRSHPDVIVTNYPYDEYNLITAVDKSFYSRPLRGCTDRLIYVPAFEVSRLKAEDERAKKLMPMYVHTPLAALCDEIVLHSEEMKERYIECLCDFSGEGYRSIWEDKITVFEDEKAEKTGTGKKTIMFCIGLATFAQYGEQAIDKIKSVFGIFEENRDKVEVKFVTAKNLNDDLMSLYPQLYERFTAEGFQTYDGEIDISQTDAYYGEPSHYATKMLNAGKPVMIMNIECR
ncbi:MAG: LicD family protein [Lachnospiraceae bacterium]|nr:LicD family protein [Lachnospiraceae bacterium]